MALGPAGVHAQQHLGEVGRIHSPGARADRDDGVALVVLAAQQGADLQVGQIFGDGLQIAVGLGEQLIGVLAALLPGHLDHGLEIVDARAELLDAPQIGLGVRQGGGDRLGGLRIVPQIRGGGPLGQGGDARAQRLGIRHRRNGGVGVSESFDLSGEVGGHPASLRQGASRSTFWDEIGGVTVDLIPKCRSRRGWGWASDALSRRRAAGTQPISRAWARTSIASRTARAALVGSVRVTR